QAEDGIRDFHVTGVQTCALPIFLRRQRGLLRTALSVFLLLSLSSCTLFDPWFSPSTDTSARIPAAVASAHPLATQAGLDILAARSEERRVGTGCCGQWSACARAR